MVWEGRRVVQCFLAFFFPVSTGVYFFVLVPFVLQPRTLETTSASVPAWLGPNTYVFPLDGIPDPNNAQQVLAAIPPGERNLLDDSHCAVTGLFHVERGDQYWTLTTFTDKGEMKQVGGDEFYITYTAQEQTQPTAIANLTDLNDGSYLFNFVGNPMPQQEQQVDTNNGTLKIVLEQSCGIGRLPPPTKEHWLTVAAINRIYLLHNVSAPTQITPFQPPNQDAKINFASFHQVVVIGDSLLGQFVCPDNGVPSLDHPNTFRPNIYRGLILQAALNSETVAVPFLRDVRRDLPVALDLAKRNHPTEKPRVALVVGSGVWDILADDLAAGGADFSVHLEACRSLVRAIRANFPQVTLFWKSMTAMHVQALTTVPDWIHIKRSYYMSNSRARDLDRLQKRLMAELNVTVLNVFDATYYAAHMTRPGDGRHYQPQLNQHILNWFYPTQ